MALILNIETSSENCSVAVSRNGKVIAAAQSIDIRSHASILTILIGKILHENSLPFSDLDAIAISKGPGSYTGLRIGVSVAKGICYGAGVPLMAINTLQSMMNGLRFEFQEFENLFAEDTIFIPMLDARRLEVYLAWFSKKGEPLKDTSAEIIDETSFGDILEDHKLVFFGNGADKIKNIIHHAHAFFIDSFVPKAEYMVTLSEKAYQEKQFENVAYFEPFYLKDFVATIPKRKVI